MMRVILHLVVSLWYLQRTFPYMEGSMFSTADSYVDCQRSGFLVLG